MVTDQPMEGLRRTCILNFFILFFFSCTNNHHSSSEQEKDLKQMLHQIEASYRESNYESVITLSEKLFSNQQVGKEADSIRANAY